MQNSSVSLGVFCLNVLYKLHIMSDYYCIITMQNFIVIGFQFSFLLCFNLDLLNSKTVKNLFWWSHNIIARWMEQSFFLSAKLKKSSTSGRLWMCQCILNNNWQMYLKNHSACKILIQSWNLRIVCGVMKSCISAFLSV